MKKMRTILISILFICLWSCSNNKDIYLFSYFVGNGEDGLHLAYSNDGYIWDSINNNQSILTPQLGENKLMRDPCIIEANGKYHMVWTIGWSEKGIGYAYSDNLINWSEQKYIPVMEHEQDSKNCWAPEIFFDDENQQYLIFWATTIPGKFAETDYQNNEGIKGQGNNHRIYYVTTKDFYDFSETKIFYDHGFNVIDATIIKAGSDYLMFLKDETNQPFKPQKNIRIAKSNFAGGPYGISSEPITGEYWAEGPTIIRIQNSWHLYFDKYRLGKYGLLVSEDLVNWVDKSESLVYPAGLRHGTVFQASTDILNDLLKL